MNKTAIPNQKNEFLNRLRRFIGQSKSLERLYLEADEEKFAIQLEAVIAAGRSLISRYLEIRFSQNNQIQISAADYKYLQRILNKLL